ncbi:hypothetical protein [Paracoccus methylovorus]|uniref:hypothetical protein n=1 Tax=Paracoccus methylovorus TaxID=2812658 RepID=UPI001F05C95A|nr:hypothetical protein [Paracoccus methylovorus]
MAAIPALEGGNSGLAWAGGSLWMGQYRGRRIHQVDPETGKVLRSIDSDRFVTGVTWSRARFGTAPGRARKATSGASTPQPARGWSAWRCRRAPGSRGWNPWRRTVLLR